ncbi:MAG: type II secretion system protein [Planctomycetota bacterium]|nr:MAG: type II secretion system protein [Planctomycetota bacterium]
MGREKWVCTFVSRVWGRTGTRTVRGFTLVELLVVIAIIALLMSILMPALSRVRDQAKGVLCLSNLNQMGKAFAMYLDDFDNAFMTNWTNQTFNDPLPAHKRYWIEALRPYYGNVHEVRCCPKATKTGTELGLGPFGVGGGTFSAWGVFPAPECGEQSTGWDFAVACDYGSYGVNAWVSNIDVSQTWGVSLRDIHWRHGNMKGADKIPLLGGHKWLDCWPNYTDNHPEYDGQSWDADAGSQMARICMNRHNGYVNWVFCDYSARPVGVKELWKLMWNKDFRTDEGPTPAEFDAAGDGWMKPFKDYE